MKHWARDYIGKPHAADADGPERFSCWGLVRAGYRARLGIALPHVAVREDCSVDEDNVRAIKAAARLLNMRPVANHQIELAEMDIVLMQGIRTHCGLVILVNGKPRVLHSVHGAGVVCERWSDAVFGMKVEIWRRVQ